MIKKVLTTSGYCVDIEEKVNKTLRTLGSGGINHPTAKFFPDTESLNKYLETSKVNVILEFILNGDWAFIVIEKPAETFFEYKAVTDGSAIYFNVKLKVAACDDEYV